MATRSNQTTGGNDEFPVVPSRAEQKRELDRWRERTEKLMTVCAKDLTALALPEQLMIEIAECKRLWDKAAIGRQMHFLTRLLVQAPDDVRTRVLLYFTPVKKKKIRDKPAAPAIP